METLSVNYKQTQMLKSALHEFISFPCQTTKLKICFFGQNSSLFWGQKGDTETGSADWEYFQIKEIPWRYFTVSHQSASNCLIFRMEVWLQRIFTNFLSIRNLSLLGFECFLRINSWRKIWTMSRSIPVSQQLQHSTSVLWSQDKSSPWKTSHSVAQGSCPQDDSPSILNS